MGWDKCWGGCPVHCGVFSSISCLYPPTHPHCDNQNVSRHGQTPLEGQNSPWPGNIEISERMSSCLLLKREQRKIMNGLSFLQQVLLSNHTVLDTGDTYTSQSDDVRLQCRGTQVCLHVYFFKSCSKSIILLSRTCNLQELTGRLLLETFPVPHVEGPSASPLCTPGSCVYLCRLWSTLNLYSTYTPNLCPLSGRT